MLRDLVAFLMKRFGRTNRQSGPLEGRVADVERLVEGREDRIDGLGAGVERQEAPPRPGVMTRGECEAIKALCTYWFDRIDARFDRIDGTFDRIDTSRSAGASCLPPMTISIDFEAYVRLQTARLTAGESLSTVIMRATWPDPRRTAGAFLHALASNPALDATALDRLETSQRSDAPPEEPSPDA